MKKLNTSHIHLIILKSSTHFLAMRKTLLGQIFWDQKYASFDILTGTIMTFLRWSYPQEARMRKPDSMKKYERLIILNPLIRQQLLILEFNLFMNSKTISKLYKSYQVRYNKWRAHF